MNTQVPQIDKEIIAGILSALKGGQNTVTYGQLSKDTHAHTGRKVNTLTGFGDPLRRIQEYCREARVPCLSAIVVNKGQQPGSGFIPCFRKLYPNDVRSNEEIVTEEQKRCSAQDDWSPLLAYCRIPSSLLWNKDAAELDFTEINWTGLVAILDQYSSATDEFLEGEVDKWRAAKCFQDNWDLEATDFPGMLSASLKEAGNLLTSIMYYPAGMLQEIAKVTPEATRASFRKLFDESIPLIARIKQFSSDMNDQLAQFNKKRAAEGAGPAKNHYQDPRAVSVYLALARDSSHYLYKADLFRTFAAMTDFDVPGNRYEKVTAYEHLCDLVLEYIKTRRPDLIERNDNFLGEELSSVDPNHHLFVQNIIFFCGDEMSRNWAYSPGEQAKYWKEMRDSGTMAIGWNELGDPSAYQSKKQLSDALSNVFGHDNPTKDTDSIWSFFHDIRPGDVIWARKGLTTVIGRGVVKSSPRHDPSGSPYQNIRDVEWEAIPELEVTGQFPRKTLSQITEKTSVKLSELNELFQGREDKIKVEPPDQDPNPDLERNYWWLTASPKIWSLSAIHPGEEQAYTIYTESGTPRRVHSNFLAARKGDLVIGYEATPVKAVVAVCEISRDTDEKQIYFKKLRDLSSPLPYSAVKADEVLSQSQFVKNPNGSLFRLSKEEYERVLELASDDDTPRPTSQAAPYDDASFLDEVYVSAQDLETMKRLLWRKKNLILQGAPGTGKTYCAKRLAWDIMGEKDDSRICFVQFHQSTSYDDMMAGYRPSEDSGFEAVPGEFLTFCDRARRDPKRPWFFIIDEINRANVSKVFGEMLMLIEANHRNEQVRLPLLDRSVSVPGNLYIIGMMNTADRGLALIDYALRRRFAFFEMEPAFDNERFAKAVELSGNSKLSALVDRVRKLNQDIADDPSLGTGFRIGHSYFCLGDAATDDDVRDIVEFELAPLVREYWFDAPEVAEGHIDKLRSVL